MSNSIDRLLLNTDTHDEFLKTLMSSLVLSTKTSNGLPKGLDYSYCNSFESYKQTSSTASDQISVLIESILGFVRPDVTCLSTDVSDPYFYDQLVETIDALLDNADIVLNAGTAVAAATSAQQMFSSLSKQSLLLNKERIIQENVKNMNKPQQAFYTEIDNCREHPFVPRIVEKFHKKVGYEKKVKEIVETEEEREQREIERGNLSFATNGYSCYYPHPYEYELQTLSYPPFLLSDLSNLKPQFPDPLRAFQYVDKHDQLLTLIKELKAVHEIAIDLEHHSVRTFQGLTCLMQISSRSKDYVVDTLALRTDLYKLGEIFADPSKVKVLHGCDRDILWLQRDFGLYIVNCFDTFQAAKVLQFSTLSLAHLVKFYCGVTLNKKYQLADWRERPLPEEMILYAKEDTHYLLYIYDSLRKELWKRHGIEGVENVLSASKKVCMSRYEKDFFDPAGYRSLLANSGASKSLPNINDLSSYQESALAKLWEWRDRRAREEDESCQFIMSNAELLRIGMKIPRYEKDVLSCSPLTEYVRSRLSEIVEMMLSISSIEPSRFTISTKQTTVSSAKRSTSVSSLSKEQALSVSEQSKRAIFTINPIITAKPSDVVTAAVPPSPQMSIDELFRIAGWKTPFLSPHNSIDKVNSSMPAFSESSKASFLTAESKQRMNRSVEDLYKSLDSSVNFEKRLLDLVKAPELISNDENQISAHENIVKVETEEKDDFLIDEVPKSFEEIYQLSSRNRKKNKEKKRNRDVDNSLESEGLSTTEKRDSILANAEEEDNEKSKFLTKDGFDYQQYFASSANNPGEHPNVDISVDGTLGFAKKIGWIKNDEEMHGLRDEYNRTIAYQQSADDSAPATENNDGRSNVASHSDLRRSHDPKGKSYAAGNNKSDRNGKVSVSQDSAEFIKQSNKGYHTLAKSSPAPFDYSKLPQQGMSALPSHEDSMKMGRKFGHQQSNSNKGGGHKYKSGAVPSNPYLQSRK